MISEIDLKTAILDLLKQKYKPKGKGKSGYRYYGIEVSEGCERPYFFVDLRLMNQRDETANIVSRYYSVFIIYQGAALSEVDYYKKVNEIRDLLCCIDKKNKKRKMVLKVKNRYIKIQNYSFGYTGEGNNILQIEFDLSFYEFADLEAVEQKMERVNMRIKEE